MKRALPTLLPAFLLAAAGGLFACAAETNQRGARDGFPARPNIVLILADDLGSGDPGCLNPASKIPTPNLDTLASEGMRLTDAHSPSGVCTPTRYGLLTGRYAWRSRLKSGVLWGYSPLLIEPERDTVAALVARHGYRTACIGKWHLGLGSAERTDYDQPLRPGPLDVGFETFFGIPASLDMPPYVYVRDDRPEQAATSVALASSHRRQGGGGFWRKGPAAPDFEHAEVLPRLADEACERIDTFAAGDEPFFLYVALSAPHTPWLPGEGRRGASEAGWYGDFVATVDHEVGRVLEALDRNGLAQDTLVIFTSDNGAHWPVADVERFEHAANLDYRGQKADIWEGGHRVPFLARWPGRIPAGSEREDLVCLTDIFATVAAIIGAELPPDAGEDSFDVLSVLLDDEVIEPPRGSIVMHSFEGMFAVREGPWKLILGRGSGGFTKPYNVEPETGGPAGQLYHLGNDLGETRNLFQEEPERVARLEELLEGFIAAGRTRQGR